jgi:hypothetical protein
MTPHTDQHYLRTTHEAYRLKRFKVPTEIRRQLSDEDVEFIEKRGAWLDALAM